MSVVELGGESVVFGEVAFPLVGPWRADLTLSGTSVPVEGSRTVLSIGGVTFVGTVETARADDGNRVSCRVIAGAAGLSRSVEPKGYYLTTRGLVASEALEVGGEALSPTADATVTTAALQHWQRVAGTVSSALRAVLGDATWRHLPDGTIWIGTDLWLPLEVDGVVSSESPAEKLDRIAVESATILPGVTFRGRRVTSVVYEIDAKKLRARVSYQAADPVKQLEDFARKATKHTDLHALYVCTVKGQNADGTVELSCADPRVSPPSRIPVRIAGVSSIKFLPGTSVLLAHEDGRADRPFVAQTYQGAVQSVSITAAEKISLTAPRIMAGGEQSLVLHDRLVAWVAQLTTAGAPIGLSVPPLVGANTTILAGA